ncbi:MAG: dienelactone hydrolase family protein [Alphaproteobacteria bacterium]|nr:dienelactone hydrolase family protein [Alphaproteobacteria bacterium]
MMKRGSIQNFFATLIVAVTTIVATGAAAGEFVEMAGPTPPEGKPVRLPGYLTRPLGSGPFPAVVLVHGCGGFHSNMISWADRLSRFGYVALAVDSFGPRGLDEDCNGAGIPFQVPDSYVALRHLSNQPFVRASHVAVMGFSQGGWSVLAALEKDGVEQRSSEKFRAGVALYPICQFSTGLMTAPVLVLIGDADNWTPSADCEAMVAGRTELGSPRRSGDRSMVELVVFPGAHHGFDLLDLSLAPSHGVTSHGYRVEYNEEATRNSIAKVRDFLARTIGSH